MLNTGEIFTLLAVRGVINNRALGQHFLRDSFVIDEILRASAPENRDVLEIGSGPGVVTAPLCNAARRVLAIEVDTQILPILEEATRGAENLRIERADILRCTLPKITAEEFPGEFDVVSNLPYAITTPILTLLFKCGLPIRRMTLMMQKEASHRLFAQPGTKEYGPLSILREYRAAHEIITDVPPESFVPPPHVDSTVVRLDLRPSPSPVADERHFFRLVSAAFLSRRKTLQNNLCAAFNVAKPQAEAYLLAANLDPRIRGEALSLAELAALSNAMRDDGGKYDEG